MMTATEIKVTLCETKKEKPASDKLEFGRTFTDHMFVADYKDGEGWLNPRVVPYASLEMDPAAMVFHYGQTVFEGLKAYLTTEGTVRLFRPDENMKRLNMSCERISMPAIDETFALDALKKLLEIDKDWIPTAPGTSLYIRPFVIANESYLGVDPSKSYKFIIILSPVGSYYKEGIHPVKILVENEYVRAVKGGTGTAKTAGNYAAALKAQQVASKKGYSQVLWLDGTERKYIEEVGAMNVFFKIGDEVVTPMLNGSILDGVTRKSVIQLLKHWDVPVVERQVSMDELVTALREGELVEAFGTGTAAVISPIGELNWKDEKFIINNSETGELSKKIYDTLTGIQTGALKDPFGWVVKINE